MPQTMVISYFIASTSNWLANYSAVVYYSWTLTADLERGEAVFRWKPVNGNCVGEIAELLLISSSSSDLFTNFQMFSCAEG